MPALQQKTKQTINLCGAMGVQVEAAAVNQTKTTNKLFKKSKENKTKEKQKQQSTSVAPTIHKFSNCWLLFGKLATVSRGVSSKNDESLWYWYPVAGSGTYGLLLLFYHRALLEHAMFFSCYI